MNYGDILSFLLPMAGTALQYRAQNNALERQQQAIAAAQAEQDAMQQQRAAQTMSFAQQMTPQATEAALVQAIAPQQQRLEGVAQQAASAMGGATQPANAGDAYSTALAKRSADELQRAIAEAGLLAKAGGAQRMMFNQGLTGADNASRVDDISASMAQAARASDRGITNAGRVNPGQMFAGGLMQAAGPSFAMRR
jgi:hypothetical protein